MLRECDYSQALLEQVNQAISDKTPLVIQGSNSKAFLGRPVTGQTLDVRCHRGIVNYDPSAFWWRSDEKRCRIRSLTVNGRKLRLSWRAH
ncbi:glycolate oxidase subunit [Escherichia coli]|nr:glycolate oxidase subunit [Escherichia coli]